MVFAKSFLVTILVTFFYHLEGQSLKYRVVKGNKDLGYMNVIRVINGSETSYSVESSVEIKVLLTFRIYYYLEEYFKNGSLKKGNAHNTLNDKMQKQSVVLGDNTRYAINLNGAVHQLTDPTIEYSIPNLYFEAPKSRDSVFSQQFAGYLPIKKTAPLTYEIESPDGLNVYKYDEKGRCVEVKVTRSFATFYFLIED